jgi:hypothetical protein
MFFKKTLKLSKISWNFGQKIKYLLSEIRDSVFNSDSKVKKIVLVT